jgi:hypothetical protein
VKAFLLVARQAILEFKLPGLWIVPALVEVAIISSAVCVTDRVNSIGLLRADDFMWSNSHGFLRHVLVWNIIFAVAAFPVCIAANIVFSYVRFLVVRHRLGA